MDITRRSIRDLHIPQVKSYESPIWCGDPVVYPLLAYAVGCPHYHALEEIMAGPRSQRMQWTCTPSQTGQGSNQVWTDQRGVDLGAICYELKSTANLGSTAGWWPLLICYVVLKIHGVKFPVLIFTNVHTTSYLPSLNLHWEIFTGP